VAGLKRTLLIDADIIAYKCSSATESSWDFNETGEGTVFADFDTARVNAEKAVEELRKTLAADEVIICLSDPHANFRKVLTPTYKSKRVTVAKPVNLQATKDWLAENYRSYMKPTLEGDDVAGILATHPTLIPGTRILVSDDKDLRQIPGKLFVPRTGERLVISQLDGDRFHMKQTLTGDPTDGYSGCPRIGPKSPFVAALDRCEDAYALWQVVLSGYESKGVPVEEAILQARLARILRWPDWDAEAQAPRLWSPPAA
jgi:DNA polymerase-1